MQMLCVIMYLSFVLGGVTRRPLSGSFARKGFIEDKDSLLPNAPQIQQTLDSSALWGLSVFCMQGAQAFSWVKWRLCDSGERTGLLETPASLGLQSCTVGLCAESRGPLRVRGS